jgi:polyisoprenoid-binding protein YceI
VSAIDTPSVVRYAVDPSQSSLSADAQSTLHTVHTSVSGVAGFIEAAWNPDGTLAMTPEPKMHVEFPVDQLRSGNAMQDREMRKLIDSARFPKVAADLTGIEPLVSAGRYKATGEITLAGRSRAYGGEFSIANDGDRLTLDGEVNLDIRDFGLKPPNLIILKVDPMLSVRLRLVAKKVA